MQVLLRSPQPWLPPNCRSMPVNALRAGRMTMLNLAVSGPSLRIVSCQWVVRWITRGMLHLAMAYNEAWCGIQDDLIRGASRLWSG